MERDLEISRGLAEAVRRFEDKASVEDTLQAIVDAARHSLPDFEHIGISTTAKGGQITTRAATTQLVWTLDDLQYELGEGPCVDAMRGQPTVKAPKIAQDDRWPHYVPQAVERGLRSQVAVRLYTDAEGTIGGLNLYSTDTEDVDDEEVDVADLFATHAAVALGHARDVDNLNKALCNRTVIGQAMGLLMAEYSVDEDAAFGFLRRTSSHTNRKLRDVAARLVAEANQKAHRREQPK